LFYIICSIYGLSFLIIAYLLTDPTIGVTNTIADPTRYMGWFLYVLIENIGSILIALFWSFVASTTSPESAKKGLALVLSGAQVGSILGPTFATYSTTIGLPVLTMISGIGLLMVPVVIKIFMVFVAAKEVVRHEEVGSVFAKAMSERNQKPKTGVMEGLRLLLASPYLLGIFGILTFYEIVGTIIDFQMKALARPLYPTPEAITAFVGFFGQCTNSVALLIVLLGTSYLMRRFGLTFCLLAFPIGVSLVLCYIYTYPVIWSAFVAMVTARGLSYGLNNPAKEVLYTPTSKDVKFKTKNWIDMFGGRSAKATGSAINNTFKANMDNLMFYGTLISLGLVGIWIFVALFVERTFNKLVKEERIIQ
jgi:ATP:ADP antiporter, AAA family